MRILRSRKALSPVVASIILIAVTVAVSIAVAAWMGALTFNFMATEQGQITNLSFSTSPSSVLITFNNTGTNPITINEVWINNNKQTGTLSWTGTSTGTTINGNSGATCNVTSTTGVTITAGSQYEVKLVSSKGNTFVRTMSAPS
jgi:flagellin-like protein